ncbi:hypothetical protein C8Q78DRAFT_1083341 [Trametes maxima]|nr:hypothetical protein C8Q78DRAFT_1083341 [Trametes maxima]
MPVSTKTLTFVGFVLMPRVNTPELTELHSDLAASDVVTLTVAFVPPGADTFSKVYPVAWKVLPISGKKSFGPFTWNDNFGGSRVEVNPNNQTATSDEYEPVTLHQTTNMLLDNTSHPPAYHFSEPETSQDPTTAAVVNRTGKVVNIGSGYITGSDPNSEFHTALIWTPVLDGNTVDVSYTPVLTIWANLPGVTESQLIPQLPNVKPLWQGDITKTWGTNQLFTLSRKEGQLVVDGPKIFPGLSAAPNQGAGSKADVQYPTINYTAELAFATPLLAYEGAAAIAKQLIWNYYPVKVTHKATGGTQVRLELGLPVPLSCDDAERDTLNAIERLPSTYGKAFITSHSGAALLLTEDWGFEKWTEINPASRQWFDATAINVAGGNGAFDGTNGDAFAKAGAIENGKGVNGSAEAATVPNGNGQVVAAVEAAAPVEPETKYRSVRRAGGGRRPALPLGA